MRSLAVGAEGLVLRYSSDVPGSVARSQESLALADQSEDAQTIGRALLNLARAIEYRDGDQRNAVPYFERMLRMADRFDTTSLIARAATELSFLNMHQGDFRTSLHYLGIAREAAGEHDRFGLFGVELTLGDIYLSEGDGQLGLTHYQHAYDLAQEVGFVKGVGSALVGMATCYLSLGDREHFRSVTAEGLRVSRSGPEAWLTSKLLANSALEAIDRDDLAAAEPPLKESLAMAEVAGSRSATTTALDTLALLRLRQKRFADAIEVAGRASAMETQLQDGSRFDAWIVAARAYRALHRPEEASRKLHEAIELAELSREGISGSERQSRLFFASRVTAYLDLVDLLVEQGKVGEALEVAERAKGRTLLDVLGWGGGAPALSVEETSREAELREAVAAANRALLAARAAKKPQAELAARDEDVANARLALEAFYATMDVAHPRLRRERAAAAAGSAAALGRAVPRGAVAIEFVATDARTHAFVISRRADGGVHIRSFVVALPREALRRKVNLLVSRLASRNLGYMSGARELYQLLLRPAERELASGRTLCIVPDGPLWALPFEVLAAPDGRFAVERQAMFYAPSLGVLREMSRPAHGAAGTPATFFGVGDPQVDGQTASHIQSLARGADLRPLPAAAQEVEAIGRLYGPRRSAVVTGPAAQEERVKRDAGAYRVLHFATHGVIDDRNPMYSHLVMARFGPDDPNDGLLEAWEMMQLHLDASLAVLSACDTARGSVEAGEGLIGMTWALFAAGCPATIASEWKVDSEATRQLMVAFHRQWLRAGPSPFAKAEALRRARLSILRTPRYQHPYFWAPFILVGVPD
jgi:CHAT domain-containing protein